MTTLDTPRIYVGTYAKYNSGSLGGAWVNLSQFTSHEDFIDHCKAIHGDEIDPELMYQDWENIPKRFMSSVDISKDFWEWNDLSDDEKELIERYIDATSDDDADHRDAQNRLVGEYGSGAEYAQQLAKESGLDIPSWIHVDWEASWENELRHDFCYSEHEGRIWIFTN